MLVIFVVEITSRCVVKIKWGKERYDDVEVNTDEPPEVFKMQLFSLTGVPPDRQKVMISGTMIAVSSTLYFFGYLINIYICRMKNGEKQSQR